MGIRNPTMIRNQAELGENNTAAVDKMYDVETLGTVQVLRDQGWGRGGVKKKITL